MKPLTSFIYKGDTLDIHGESFLPPVEWMGTIASYRVHWCFSLSEYDLYETVVVFVSYLIYYFSYLFSILETVFSIGILSYCSSAAYHQYLCWPHGLCRMHSFPQRNCKNTLFVVGLSHNVKCPTQINVSHLNTLWVCFLKPFAALLNGDLCNISKMLPIAAGSLFLSLMIAFGLRKLWDKASDSKWPCFALDQR